MSSTGSQHSLSIQVMGVFVLDILFTLLTQPSIIVRLIQVTSKSHVKNMGLFLIISAASVANILLH